MYGVPKEREGTISESIGRSKDNIRKWAVGRGARGELRPAITHYKILATIGGVEGKGSTEDDTFSYVEAQPKTGRTHQLRVHFRSLNHPIVADTLYASGREKVLGFDRLALHARAIKFVLPGGKDIEVVAPYPADFENARKAFELGG